MKSKIFSYLAKVLFLIIFAFCLNNKAKAENDSCPALWEWNTKTPWEYHNPDSVKVDTCINSKTYKKEYSKKGYLLIMYSIY